VDDLDLPRELEEVEGQDDVPEVPEKAATSPGDIWQMGDHLLICGDAADPSVYSRLLGRERVHMLFTDPPYGVSYGEKTRFLQEAGASKGREDIPNDDLSPAQLRALLFTVFSIIRDLFAEYSCYYVTSPVGDWLTTFLLALQDAGMPCRHVLVWKKSAPVLGRADYDYQHEPILYGWVKKHRFYGRGQFRTSVWEIPKPSKSKLHPTMKPVALIENALLNSTEQGDIVLDPFAGSGSTLIACEKTGRKARLIEIDPRYCDVIVRRWEEFTGGKARRKGAD